MRGRSYPEWKIRHFVGSSITSMTKSKITTFNCEAAMRIAIPSLDTVMVGGFPEGYHRGS
jgi:hypothetical protein